VKYFVHACDSFASVSACLCRSGGSIKAPGASDRDSSPIIRRGGEHPAKHPAGCGRGSGLARAPAGLPLRGPGATGTSARSLPRLRARDAATRPSWASALLQFVPSPRLELRPWRGTRGLRTPCSAPLQLASLLSPQPGPRPADAWFRIRLLRAIVLRACLSHARSRSAFPGQVPAGAGFVTCPHGPRSCLRRGLSPRAS